MATWSFRDALEELEVRRQFDESMLQSDMGLRLGDIRFAEIQTSIKMRAVRFSTFLHYIKDGSFNHDNLAPHCCSQTTAILLAFLPDRHIQDIESIGIGCVIRRYGTPMGDVSSIGMMIDSVRSVLKKEADKRHPHRTGLYDAHWELWWAHGLCHRTSILCCICCGLPGIRILPR